MTNYDHVQLVSIQTGKRVTHPHPDGEWTTAFYKTPLDPDAGEPEVTADGLVNDEQADKRYHGGPDKALMAYSFDHFSFWKKELGNVIPCGGFGENLTISGVTEDDVCIGDQWSINDVLVEVSQPRQPCWKLGRRWDRKDLPKLVIQTGFSGWYFRVLKAGLLVRATLELAKRPHPQWTISRANQVFYGSNPSERAMLASLPPLANVWKRDLQGD